MQISVYVPFNVGDDDDEVKGTDGENDDRQKQSTGIDGDNKGFVATVNCDSRHAEGSGVDGDVVKQNIKH